MILTVFFLIQPFSENIFAQRNIIDHTCTDINVIPENAIIQAKENLHIAYGHTSHGSQLTTGMNELDDFMGGTGLYKWNDGPQKGSLDIDDYFTGGDLGHNGDTAWAANTRTYLNNSNYSDVNVIIWSWCGGASDNTEEGIQIYLDKMNQLEHDYPSVKFVYMTGHSDGSGESGNLHIRNQQIRDYCLANNKVLYDFYDIECYDPDGNYFGDKLVNDNCDYDTDGNGSRDGNWATEWQNSHSEGVDWYNCSAAHSQALNGNRKAYAAWWLWAKLAGWDGIPFHIELTTLTANISDSSVILNWNTVEEVNSYGFNIERLTESNDTSISSGSEAWITIGFIAGHGISNSLKNYSFTDKPDTLAGKYFYRLKQICIAGAFEYSEIVEVNFDYTAVIGANFKLPTEYNLSQNYPNPFNPTTTISFSIPEYSNVKLEIFNSVGQLVTQLVDQNYAQGKYTTLWNGRNDFGVKVNSGIYFYRITANNFAQTNRIILLK